MEKNMKSVYIIYMFLKDYQRTDDAGGRAWEVARGSPADAGGRVMKKAIVLDANDIKLLIAEKYGVKPENVIKSQYSYTVITDDEPEKPEEWMSLNGLFKWQNNYRLYHVVECDQGCRNTMPFFMRIY